MINLHKRCALSPTTPWLVLGREQSRLAPPAPAFPERCSIAYLAMSIVMHPIGGILLVEHFSLQFKFQNRKTTEIAFFRLQKENPHSLAHGQIASVAMLMPLVDRKCPRWISGSRPLRRNARRAE